ncbi:MAG TPA: hypothetical protein VG389_05075 [Myxococcota bacterium]|jgi:hypothetical protein|nr:hypothetical protein [Myxococcota bacterium]
MRTILRFAFLRVGGLAVALAAGLAVAGCGGCKSGNGLDAGTDSGGGLPQCSDGLDNDGDALTDFPADPGCVDGADGDETQPPQCSDGLDNDADGDIDTMDVGCSSPDDDSELNPECSDTIDNDGDGLIDFPADPDCVSVADTREAEDPVCSDMMDNDNDGRTDFPADPGCTDANDPSESDVADCGGLVPVTDMTMTGLLTGTSTVDDSSLFSGSCGGDGPEGIGFLNVSVPLTLLSVNTFGTAFDNAIYIRTDCGDTTSELACGTFLAGNSPVVELTGVAPGGYYLFADGATAANYGAWFLHAFGIIAPGQACTPGDLVFRCDSTSGQICSEPIAGMGFVCNAGQCSDGFDNDSDAITDFPLDPGCIEPADNDETDPIMTPQCYDGTDNDGDGFTDYPADPGCNATADDLEQDDCIMGVPLSVLAADGSATGSTSGVSNFEGSCTAGFTPSGPEVVYVFNLLYTADVTATTVFPATTMDTALYIRTVCDDTSTEVGCNDNDPMATFSSGSTIDLPGLAPGTYFVFVDGMNGSTGAYRLEVTGVFASGAPCDPMSTAFVCNASIGDACLDPGGTGAFACLPAECSDGADNDGDAVVDYPAEPGCLGPADSDETDPMTPPVCSDGVDNDGDTIIDYPGDPGCFYAADATEEDNCIPGVPFTELPPDGHYFGTIASPTGSFDGTCTVGFLPSSDEDIFILPVPSDATVTFTTALPGSGFTDTAIYLRSTCDDTTTEIGCNDNVPPTFTASTLVEVLTAGTYFLFVDGMNGSTGSYELQVSGLIGGGQPCDPADLIYTCDVAAGYVCMDPGTGTNVCVAGACSDTLDNDGDALADYPLDPGCTGASDTDETDPAVAPQCADGADNDGDALIDYPADTGCSAASDDDEACTVFGTDTYGYTGCEESLAVGMLPCADISASGTLVPSAGSCDDCYGSVPIGFSFDFYGTAYTSMNVGSNGKLVTTDATYTNSCLPYPSSGAMIDVWWDDLYTSGGTGGEGAWYALTGTAPNRIFEVQWLTPPCCSIGGDMIDVRVLLHETTNQIDVCYVDTTFGTSFSDNGASATLGIQNGAGSVVQYSCNSPVVTPGLLLHYVHP